MLKRQFPTAQVEQALVGVHQTNKLLTKISAAILEVDNC